MIHAEGVALSHRQGHDSMGTASGQTIESAIVTTQESKPVEVMTPGINWAGIILAWKAELQQRTGSERTPTEYGRYADHFQEILSSLGRGLESATPADAHAFAYAALPDHRRGGRPGKAPGPASVNVRLAALRSLYDFARRMGVVGGNPADADHVRRPQLPTPQPKDLTPEQIGALMAATPDNLTGQRDRAAILVFVLTGLRRTELLGLTAGDLTDDAGTPMYRVRAKGGKIRRRELPAPAWAAIRDYLAAAGRPLESLDDDARIFPISSTTLYDNLRRYGSRIGRDDLTVHTLRHSAAKLRRRAGASLEEVQALLGHASIATTARYLAQLEGQHDDGWQAAMQLLTATGGEHAHE